MNKQDDKRIIPEEFWEWWNEYSKNHPVDEFPDCLVMETWMAAKEVYDKLPNGIQEALNSGDGTYRP